MATASHHLNARRARWCAALALAVAGALLASTPARAYDWPVKPFDRQHPVRGFFGDPRILRESHGLHWGVDISAPNGTPVYAIEEGTAFLDGARSVAVRAANGHTFAYWHIVPAVRDRQRVRRHQVLGHVEPPWAHVHLGESIGGRRVNPLRSGGLAPFRDPTRPSASSLTVERDGVPLAGRRASGRVDLVVEAHDETPLAVPAPWDAKPVAPALVRWRIAGAAGSPGRWTVAADFRGLFPVTAFGDVYARWTRQNKAGRCGRYRFVLRRDWDTRQLVDGLYRVEVEVSDLAGNAGRYAAAITVANGSDRGR
jgi:hypothetical protein